MLDMVEGEGEDVHREESPRPQTHTQSEHRREGQIQVQHHATPGHKKTNSNQSYSSGEFSVDLVSPRSSHLIGPILHVPSYSNPKSISSLHKPVSYSNLDVLDFNPNPSPNLTPNIDDPSTCTRILYNTSSSSSTKPGYSNPSSMNPGYSDPPSSTNLIRYSTHTHPSSLVFTATSSSVHTQFESYDIYHLESLTFHRSEDPGYSIRGGGGGGDSGRRLQLRLNELVTQGEHYTTFVATRAGKRDEDMDMGMGMSGQRVEYIIKLAYLLDMDNHAELRLPRGYSIKSALINEAQIITGPLRDLQGVVIPRFHGLWFSPGDEWGLIIVEKLRGKVHRKWEDLSKEDV